MPRPRWTRRFGDPAWLYLGLAVATGALSLALFALWLGPALVWANPIVWAASAVAMVFMLVESGAVGWRRLPWPLAATALLGPACGLSVFLFLRAARRSAAMP